MKRSVLVSATGVLLIAGSSLSCGGYGGTPSSPTPPSTGTFSTISVLGQRGSQSFSPNPAGVAQGQNIVWRNADSRIHRIVFNDGSLDTGDIQPGAQSPILRLNANGANYHCSIHPTMVGSINQSTGEPPPCIGQYCP